MIKLFLYVLAGLIFTACAQAQPNEIPTISSGYLYKVESPIPGKVMYVCGQRPFNANGELVGAGDITQQTQQLFENLRTSLQTVNMTLRNVTQVTYLVKGSSTKVDATQMQALNSQATSFFSQVPGIVEMKSVARNVRDDVLIEIEVIAVR